MLAYTASLFLIANIQVALDAPPKQGCALAAGLRDEISRKYPGTHLVTLADLNEEDRKLFQKEHGAQCPGLVSVDFYGDGKATFALVLIRDETTARKTELVVAHQRQNGWETISLDIADAAPVPVVWREGPGKYDDVYGQKTLSATRPVVVLCGYESWAILYAWTGKQVEKIWISD
jgi:hypothetical protein